MSVFDDDNIRTELLRAWLDSLPGTADAHEEGGFILRNADGSLRVERWSRGAQDRIIVPPHSGGFRDDCPIIATFHTHPNTGPEFLQEPSLTDIRAVRNDPDLAHLEYEGEYVIASEWIYCVQRSGLVQLFGRASTVLCTS
jgi:hypothetical protein